MPRLEFFLVSEDLAVDQATNRLSMFNVLEEIRADHFPVILPKASAVSLWESEEGDEGNDFQALLRITIPDGQTHEIPANFRMTTKRHRIMNRAEGLPLTEPGILRFDVLLNGIRKASHFVDVFRSDGPAGAP